MSLYYICQEACLPRDSAPTEILQTEVTVGTIQRNIRAIFATLATTREKAASRT